jgi:hypothetical protein
MVFSRTRAPCSSTELRAAAQIVFNDLNRLNRSNNSLKGAFMGKLSRILPHLKGKLQNTTDVARLLRYDAKNLLRSRVNPSERMEDPRFFFPVCFTCARHFETLRIALSSLDILAPSVKEINIYMDKADPFTAVQCELLRSESRYPLSFRQTVYPMSPPGLRVILSELYAFQKLAEQMRTGDFLVKFDSDVIFLSDTIFQFVANGGAGAIGTGVNEIHPSVRNDYLQGGCYFIVGAELRAMVNSRITATALALLREHSILFEDQFISPLLRQCGTKIVRNKFLYYDPALAEPGLDETELEARLRAIPATASVLHFEGNKSNMRRAAEKLLPSLAAVWNRYQGAS